MQKPIIRTSFILSVILLLFTVSACQSVATAPPSKPPVQKPPTQDPALSSGGSSAEDITIDNSTPTSEPAGGAKNFVIDNQRSEARFVVDEVLRGEDTTVIGATGEISGQFMVDFSDLSATTAGSIEVGAGSLVTPESRRNTAIRNFILQTNTYPTLVFTPIEFIGLSGSVEIGQSYTFQIAGDLTIRDITQPVVFDVTATAVSESEFQGSAVTSIQRPDYNLTIPSVPFVASVSETVRIEIDLVATAQ